MIIKLINNNYYFPNYSGSIYGPVNKTGEICSSFYLINCTSGPVISEYNFKEKKIKIYPIIIIEKIKYLLLTNYKIKKVLP